MALFGGSTSKTTQNSTQLGAEGEGNNVLGEGASVTTTNTDYFPAAVANFADNLLGRAFGLADKSVSAASASQATLGSVAAREKTPLTEWLPFAAVAAGALVVVVLLMKKG